MSLRSSMFVLLATTAMAVPAYAADKAAAKSVVYEDNAPVVVVTPLKSESKLEDVPFAVTVIDKNSKAKTQAQSVDDMLRDVPNFSSAGGPRTVSEEPSLRGLSDRRIVIKVDGIRRNFRAQYGGRYFFDPYMISRVEVVRGANSTIDGTGAMGGVMQFFTPKVSDQLAGTGRNWGAETKLGYQTGNNELSTLLSGYGQTKNMDIYTAFSYRNSDSYRAGNGNDIEPSQAEPKNGLVKAGLNITPNQRAEFRFSRFYDKSGMPTSPFQPLSVAGNFAAMRESAVTDYSLKYNIKGENGAKKLLDLNTIFYRSEYAINVARDFDSRLDETDFTTNGMDVYNNASLNYFGMDHKLTTGVEYFENKQEGRRNGATRALLGDGQDSNLGLYVQQETKIGDRLTVVPGIRFDHYELEPGNNANPSQDRNRWSPKLGVNYRLTDAWSAYGSVASAFRTPTMTELYSTGFLFPGNTLISNPNLRPEKAVNKEIGVRFKQGSVFADYDHLGFTAAIFKNDIKDYIEQVIGATTTQFRNVASAELKGFELEGRYRLSNVGTIVNFGMIRGNNETANQPLSDVPQNKFSGALEYYALENTLTTGLRVTHNANQDRIAAGQPLITTSDGSTVFDLYGSYTPAMPNSEIGSFRLDFGIDNLFDKNYRRQLQFLPEMGRNAKMTATWKF